MPNVLMLSYIFFCAIRISICDLIHIFITERPITQDTTIITLNQTTTGRIQAGITMIIQTDTDIRTAARDQPDKEMAPEIILQDRRGTENLVIMLNATGNIFM